MIKNYLLFFTPMCPNCPSVKDYMKMIRLEGKFVDATERNGYTLAAHYSVFSVPTVIFFDEQEHEIGRAQSIGQIKRLIENKQLADI